MQLAWTPRWQLSPIAMQAILVDPEKRTASVKSTLMSVEDKETVIKRGLWFGRRLYQADGYTEITPDTLCAVFCHWVYITLQYLDMYRPYCQLCAGQHTARKHNCEVN